MQISQIIQTLESLTPLSYQESYDNCGMQVGDAAGECSGVLLSLDVTEAVIDEAIRKKCNLIIAHHPLIFGGLKRLTGKNWVERCVIKAIQNNIAIYAAHTNLDNMHWGVNAKIAEKLELEHTQVLAPMTHKLYKLITYVPQASLNIVRESLFQVGAGHIGAYSECSYAGVGTGTFRGDQSTNPTIGKAGGAREEVAEFKLEVLVQEHQKSSVVKALLAAHPYEEVAYELIKLENANQYLGAGMLGSWAEEKTLGEALGFIKERMQLDVIRYTSGHGKPIKRVALCGGSGSFLLPNAIAAAADIFITADYKYHQFFDAETKISIADIGHYESEQFTVEIFMDILNEKFPNFAVYLSETKTNPINYYF